ncbi:MAG TPA: hypothetical protein VKH41_15460 [Myxococcota bacterium]|nr:hypothetical protein [Myxococcota bacterium]
MRIAAQRLEHVAQAVQQRAVALVEPPHGVAALADAREEAAVARALAARERRRGQVQPLLELRVGAPRHGDRSVGRVDRESPIGARPREPARTAAARGDHEDVVGVNAGEHAGAADLLGQPPQQRMARAQQREPRAHRVAEREQPRSEPVVVGRALDPARALEAREQHGAGGSVEPERARSCRRALAARMRREVFEHGDHAIGGRRLFAARRRIRRAKGLTDRETP